MAPALKMFGHEVIDAIVRYGLTVKGDLRPDDISAALALLQEMVVGEWKKAEDIVRMMEVLTQHPSPGVH